MKKITLLLVSLMATMCMMAADITGGTKLYLKPNAYWQADGARFAAYFFGGSSVAAWTDMKVVAGEETVLYVTTAPAGTWTNVIFCRMNPATTVNDWDQVNKWNQTSDLTYDGTNNLYTVAEGAWDGSGSWSQYTPSVPAEPEITLTVADLIVVGQPYTIEAILTDAPASAVLKYSVKEPNSDSYTVLAGNTFTPNAEGTYSIKVEAIDGENVLTYVEKYTTAVVKPEEITIKVQIPEGLSSWDASAGIYFYAWPLEPAFVATTSESDNWYSYTFNTDDIFPLNFIVVNGASWEAIIPEGGTASDSRRQSVDMVNIVASGCYVMANGSEIEGDGNSWKKVLNPAECPDPGTSTGLLQNRQEPLFTIENRVLNIELEEAVMIRIYNLGGQMVDTQFTNRYSRLLGQGTYILHIGDTATKAIVF